MLVQMFMPWDGTEIMLAFESQTRPRHFYRLDMFADTHRNWSSGSC
jgi:hypothetical protein